MWVIKNDNFILKYYFINLMKKGVSIGLYSYLHYIFSTGGNNKNRFSLIGQLVIPITTSLKDVSHRSDLNANIRLTKDGVLPN